MSLQERTIEVEQRVLEACLRSGRKREEVQIIAVTKYVSLEAAGEAIHSGLTQIGENRWQDAQAKWEAYGDEANWHFIGHLQTNKVKDVIGKFQFIHSLDRLSLAEELHKKALALNIQVDCFIQLNVSGEETKYGLAPDEFFLFAEQLRELPNIRIVGLMTMAPYEAEKESTRPVFRELRRLRDELNARQILDYSIPHLSMGMSNDFEVAIEEGATWVRLGSVLVGK
ncbi:YggS family pyridoxal phosphate-dependent enzyme [Paenibacillus psychroresistens]|uniref:Pyridoxal phosphate homeostasis protein n=1 Tax=Paenibacillus psychroresistens TaxID=1778678 RepID=A0A6B8RHS2_9BACL|nr:YggS family pyridoxal phosphate-dependent enzyme [Paenibacillus psychroresistens]QGQ95790.1 YggS family pyridoxal phosphate-dependent enzyme [Paenibacillus psychroresistens]